MIDGTRARTGRLLRACMLSHYWRRNHSAFYECLWPRHWLARIEDLGDGDACEIRLARRWTHARVLRKVSNSGLWQLEYRDEHGNPHRASVYIEQVRCVGQLDAWPR